MRKRFTLVACAASSLPRWLDAIGLAADMPRPAPSYAAPLNWTGFYVGIYGGYGWGKSNWTIPATGATTGDFNLTGALVGGTIGYNLHTRRLVWGAEADIDASGIKDTNATGCREAKIDWLATALAPIGYAFDCWMPFITGGAAFSDIKMTPVGFGSETAIKIGWTGGGGP